MYKSMLTAVALMALGTGMALAQGAPPNSAWSSGYANYVQSQATAAAQAHKFAQAQSQRDATQHREAANE